MLFASPTFTRGRNPAKLSTSLRVGGFERYFEAFVRMKPSPRPWASALVDGSASTGTSVVPTTTWSCQGHCETRHPASGVCGTMIALVPGRKVLWQNQMRTLAGSDDAFCFRLVHLADKSVKTPVAFTTAFALTVAP